MGHDYPIRAVVLEQECGAGRARSGDWDELEERIICGSMGEIHGMTGKIDTVWIQLFKRQISIKYSWLQYEYRTSSCCLSVSLMQATDRRSTFTVYRCTL
jgi:hypothetical protein